MRELANLDKSYKLEPEGAETVVVSGDGVCPVCFFFKVEESVRLVVGRNV